MSRKHKRGGQRRNKQHARVPGPEHDMQAPGEEREHPEVNESAARADDDAVTMQAGFPAAPSPATEHADRDVQATELGRQLQEARERQGLALDDAAHRLHLPWRVVAKLEQGDWEGIDSPIYLQGYLRSYTELLGLPTPDLVRKVAREAVQPQPLVSTGGISRGRYMMQRYAVAGTYLVITALIVVPLIVLGLNGGLKNNLARLAPLDPPALDASVSSGEGMPAVQGETADAGGASTGRAQNPLMASMAPVSLIDDHDNRNATSVPARQQVEKPTTPQQAASDTAPAQAEPGLSITLSAPSWVEITAEDGSRVEYALLDPGRHEYRRPRVR